MAKKEWTIMIYMAGDNNLSVDMAYSLEQIKGVAGTEDSSPNLLVYYDGSSPNIPTMYCDFSEPDNPRYVRSYKVTDKLYPVQKKRNENAADPRSVINFIDWCLNKVKYKDNGKIKKGRRAKKYALIFSGHTLGFQDIGLFKDESTGKSMNMKAFYAVLQGVVLNKKQLEDQADKFGYKGEQREVETTVLLGKKFDILGFDSCVMGMLEVGYQFSFIAKTIIASEGSVPSAGWTYAKLLGSLAREENRNLPTRRVAELFVKQFIRSQDAYTVGGVSVDMAAWDTSRLEHLADAVDGLAGALIDCFKDPTSRLYRQMERLILQVHWKCQSYMYDQNVDLGDFCELLANECFIVVEELGGGDDLEPLVLVHNHCLNVLNELQQAVILSGYSGGAYQYSNGISMFFPWSREAYEASKKNYESLWFASDVKKQRLSWIDFLKKYLYEVSLRRCETPAEEAMPGCRYRYPSGVIFDERSEAGAAHDAGDTKIWGQEGSKIWGQEGSKIWGQEGSKIWGQEGSKIWGQEGSKIWGQEGSKIWGQEGSKLAGGGSNALLNSMRLFKNIEGRWDISGFTKKPEE